MKKALKIKLANHLQFQKAWDALIKLGYHSEIEVHTAPYLFCYEDGHIGVEYMDVEGADLSNPDSAFGYFTNHKHPEITLDGLLDLLKENGHEPFFDDISLLKQERPLFEANYVKNGGDLSLIKWSECHDGTGSYEVNWGSISGSEDPDFEEDVMEHASNVQSCLMAWVECAKSKLPPLGYYLMPLQPIQEMVDSAKKELEDCEDEDIEDRIVFTYQAMVKTFIQSQR